MAFAPVKKPRRRALPIAIPCLALLLALIVVGGADPSGASAAPGVIVETGERTPFVPAAQITRRADVASETFQEPGSGPTPDGLSLRRLMAMVGVDPDRVTAVRVTGDDGRPLELPRNSLQEPFPSGNGPPIPPVVWVDGEGVHFVRVEGGRNPAQRSDAAGEQPLLIEVEGGESIAVTATASRTEVDAGASVRFRAVAQHDGERLTYRWDFGDGARGRGEEVTHAFRRPGRYPAYVTVTAGSAMGRSNRIVITVGDPPPPPEKKRPEPEPEPSPDEVVAATPSDRPGRPPETRADRREDAGAGSERKPDEPGERAESAPSPAGRDGTVRVQGELVSSPAGGEASIRPGGMPFEEAEIPRFAGRGAGDRAIALVAILLAAAGLGREWWASGEDPWW